VLPAFVNDAPTAQVMARFTAIEQAAAPAQPLLVYLRPTDIDAAIRRVHRDREPVWVAWNLESVVKMPWAHSRNLDGRAAVVAMYRAWDALVCEMLAGSALHSVTIDDPQQDRDAALQWIRAAVRP